MKCQFCDNPASFFLTDIINKKKREVQLCEECARQHNLIPEGQPELNVPALLQFLMSQAATEKNKGDLNNVACPHCGLKYAQFRAQGRLGCPADYNVFAAALEPLLERIHRHVRHQGKVPSRFQAGMRAVQLRELNQQLEEAIREERFEDAAQLRDRIRNMGTAE